MAIAVKVPALGESVKEAKLLKWHKRDGDVVRVDDNRIGTISLLRLLLSHGVALQEMTDQVGLCTWPIGGP